jgi:hypothetical protein
VSLNNGAYSVARDWLASNTFSWTPTSAGSYRIVVWARSNGNTFDGPENNAYRVVDFSVTPLSVASLTADKTSPQPGGTTIIFTATAVGGVAPIQYKWWVSLNNGAYSVARDWLASNTFSWTPTSAGSYRIVVWARSNGNTFDGPENNAYRVVDFTVTPLSAADIGTSPATTVTVLTADTSPSQVRSMIFVEPNGKCRGNTPCYSAIQQAINLAARNTTIKFAQMNLA